MNRYKDRIAEQFLKRKITLSEYFMPDYDKLQANCDINIKLSATVKKKWKTKTIRKLGSVKFSAAKFYVNKYRLGSK